ncbi:pentapeptide repeat-containing protein [Endozoicomonas sp.]|uniref:pentapeptide repeat-containing protein n=1 Tax=Endozoicomonas sp. TaxID=1892382 RepID=UPI00288427E9|nr:pentapeptide repeat-containing protein [Endozoicomonas sp.]
MEKYGIHGLNQLQVSEHQCSFSGKSGRCKDLAESGSQFCFWHDPDVDKTGEDVKERLEERAKNGQPMDGFILRKANLDNVDLVNHCSNKPFQLINSDLSRASLHKAHLYRIDLSGSRLLKANLSHANLHRANLSGCNLLGVNLKNSLLDHVCWGDKLFQEKEAEANPENAAAMYEEAEESARNIRRHCEQQGMVATAGHFFYRERVFHRLQMPKYSRQRLLSLVVDLISGYGESPLRVVMFSLGLIFVCSFLYLLTGIQDGDTIVRFNDSAGLVQNLFYWLDCLYFSVVTFTTLGYGDLTPLGVSRIIAASEAFTGSFSLALFVVLFVKKMIR